MSRIYKKRVSYFIFDDVYLVEMNAYPCGPLIGVGRVEERGTVNETIASSLQSTPQASATEEAWF